MDKTNNISVLAWDRESVALIGKKASEIALGDGEVTFSTIYVQIQIKWIILC